MRGESHPQVKATFIRSAQTIQVKDLRRQTGKGSASSSQGKILRASRMG